MSSLEILPVFSNGREETDTMDIARRNGSIMSMLEIFDIKCYDLCEFQYLSNDLELIKQIVTMIVVIFCKYYSEYIINILYIPHPNGQRKQTDAENRVYKNWLIYFRVSVVAKTVNFFALLFCVMQVSQVDFGYIQTYLQ